MTKTRIRLVTELGLPKARVIPDYMKPQFSENSNESEKVSSENRTTIVKQKHIEKYKRTKPSER